MNTAELFIVTLLLLIIVMIWQKPKGGGVA